MSNPSASARFLKSYSDPAQVPNDGLPQIALLGRSNAGKSTLINSITGIKNLAHASGTPGRTRLINLFELDRALLVDLPGYGFSKGSHADQQRLTDLINGYLANAERLRGAVVILDCRMDPTKADQHIIESLRLSGIPFVLVANKVDKLSWMHLNQRLQALQAAYPDEPVIAHSSVNQAGRGELRDAIQKMAAR